ncbi:MAG: adenylyl-sulfate kinase, partial [Anaerolineales bacterium]
VRHGGAAICAAVSPYRAARNYVRNSIGEGRFIEVFVNTPQDVCERRDTKGLYLKARRGEIQGFTRIDDPYEAPANAEIELDAARLSPEVNAHRILDYLREQAFLKD